MLTSTNFNANSIVLAVVLLLGLLLAVVVGDSVASERYTYLGLLVLIACGVPLGLRLGANFWLLIVLSITADARLGFAPVPMNVSELCTSAAALIFILQVVFRRIGIRTEVRLVDVLVWLNVVWLVVTFVKNPTGFALLGSDSVGARKYFSLGIAFLGYFMLSRCKIPAKWALGLPLVLACAWALPAALNAIAIMSPELASVITRVYAVNVQDASSPLAATGALGSEARIFGLEAVAKPFFLALCSYYAPVTFVNPLFPFRALGFFVSFILAGLSGFRSALLAMGGYMLVGTWLRGRTRDILPMAAVGILMIVAMSFAVQSGARIPLTIQRALSVLPLGWDPEAVKTAEDTTTWRVDMWRDAWNDPNYFKDKVFGDGFGFTYQELMLFANQMQGLQGLVGAASYEMFIIRGSLHNGPLSSIRYGGFIGLFLLTFLMIMTAIYAYRVVQVSKNTVYMPIALFVAIPLIYELFAFYIIFGAYDNHMIQYFLGLGMLNLISNSILSQGADSSA
jgi:hypothetical protein